MPAKVVFATGYTPGSSEVLKLATTLARAEDARLPMVHVTPLENYPAEELTR